MIVNVCPSGIASAPPEAVWPVLIDTERYGEWADAEVVHVNPPGLASPGQHIELAARALGRQWRVTIDVGRMDPNCRWIDLLARTPFDVVNREHVTLSPTDGGRTLVRFN
ncbi:MAG: SRPBCC family protein [Chloroflexi bacterium]|nr:SRPBCC family protein [Chloroflexota bacterium]